VTRRVVVTGLGVVTSVGKQLEEFWSNLTAGKSGIKEIKSFSTESLDRHFGGEVSVADEVSLLSESESKIYGRATRFGIEATHNAVEDAGLNVHADEFRKKIGVVIGTTFGEAQIIEKITSIYCAQGISRVNSSAHLKQYNPNAISVNIGKKFKFSGPNMVIPTACAAGNYAIAYASMLIKSGAAPIMIAGGADPFSHVSFSGFRRLGVMANSMCQPFDKDREGMLVGEGAASLVLEDYEVARDRGAKMYAEIAGFGFSCDANHMTIPEVGGIMSVMKNALANAGLGIKDVDYICAHGTGTRINDKLESEAIRRIFYDSGNTVPVSSIKSMLGHTMGAASAIEAVASVMSIKTGLIPPTINFRTPDPECDIDCVPNTARKSNPRVVLNNSFAFGGNNCSVLFANVN